MAIAARIYIWGEHQPLDISASYGESGPLQVEIKNIDKQGRISIPAIWRSELLGNARQVLVMRVEDGIKIVPVKPRKLSDFFDTVEADIDPSLFSDYHKLKAELARKRYAIH